MQACRQRKQLSILVVDDEESVSLMLARILRGEGYDVDTASTFADALTLIQQKSYLLAFVDIMLDDKSGIDLVREIKEHAPNVLLVMITGHPDVNSAASAVRLGVFDYVAKPIKLEVLSGVVKHALKSKQLTQERERNRANMHAIFSSVSEAIIMIDSDELLLEFNSAAATLCGYSNDLIGRPLTALARGCAGTCRCVLIESLASGSKLRRSRFECHGKDGALRIVTLTASPVIEPSGAIKGVVGVIRDETCLDNLERALKKRKQFQRMIGHNAAMQKLYSQIDALADLNTTVLINGESGTGKELVAAALHACGSHKTGPIVKLNCSALSDALLETELFGHVRGAFTGAVCNKAGHFEMADGGTIFLDEIGDISPSMQMRLLRVLQEREVVRVGSTTPTKVDVRVIAATNHDLAEKMRRGTFRQDLYYRINVVCLDVPPLRARRDDLPLLAEHFLKIKSAKLAKNIQFFSDDVMAFFLRCDWPGNVRQLEHAIEHACILCRSAVITMNDLPQDLLPGGAAGQELTIPPKPAQSKITLEEALEISGGNKSRAARLLGINRRTIYRKLPH